ncbi:host range factor 1 protein [Dasychira pudibunda nucleopolyhedrovirus]|nr:host range factor 1 protein [Dasychira pudibunda nucleopolyhedrovirus]WHM28313.1 hrf-1 [Dasychira pudibunda nucleopolyhedrovirus]
MGMDARIYVNDDVVDSYKCKNVWRGKFDATKVSGFEVDYEYESGYGNYDLMVYMRNADGERQTWAINGNSRNNVVDSIQGKSEQRASYVKFAKFFKNPTIVSVVVKMEA